jgi:hypothetical protein
MSQSGLFTTQIVFFNRFGRNVSVIRDNWFGIGRTTPAIRDTHVRVVVLVYSQARATPNDRLRPNATTTLDYLVGQIKRVLLGSFVCLGNYFTQPE